MNIKRKIRNLFSLRKTSFSLPHLFFMHSWLKHGLEDPPQEALQANGVCCTLYSIETRTLLKDKSGRNQSVVSGIHTQSTEVFASMFCINQAEIPSRRNFVFFGCDPGPFQGSSHWNDILSVWLILQTSVSAYSINTVIMFLFKYSPIFGNIKRPNPNLLKHVPHRTPFVPWNIAPVFASGTIPMAEKGFLSPSSCQVILNPEESQACWQSLLPLTNFFLRAGCKNSPWLPSAACQCCTCTL